MKAVFEYDQYTGMLEEIKKDSSGVVVVKQHQDVEDIFKLNKQDRLSDKGWKGDLHKVASIPLNIVNIWKEELKAIGRNPWPFAKENRGWLIAKLNDSNFQNLRTKEGRI